MFVCVGLGWMCGLSFAIVPLFVVAVVAAAVAVAVATQVESARTYV